MKKQTFYTEIAFFVSLVVLAAATALTVYGDFGISMVVAPAYILHLKICESLPFFTFGVAGYTLQALILILLMIIIRKFKVSYLLSFVSAVLYGFVLDGAAILLKTLPNILYLRILLYIVGVLLCCASIGMMFFTYFPPQAYELFVKEIAIKWGKPVHIIKMVYDGVNLVLSIVLSLLLFGSLNGIGIGTVVCAVIYGPLINMFQKLFNKIFVFKDKYELRKFFEERENL